MGSMYGPRVDAYVNGGHPAMLGVQECNSDVQLPYRFPVTAETHCVACPHDCIDTTDESKLIEAAQVAQDAQAGYACDYCNKRQPMAFNEVKECCKGHQDLTERVGDRSVNYRQKAPPATHVGCLR